MKKELEEHGEDGSGAELERQLAAAGRESDDLRREMGAVRQAVATEVEDTWTSPWKSPETVDAKLRARLAGHRRSQALRARPRELDGLRRSLAIELEKGTTP